MTERNLYALKLSEALFENAPQSEPAFQTRSAQPDDAAALAQLMLDAYRGAIDDDGETLDDARAEVNAFLAGERGGPPWLPMSFLACAGPRLIGACLVSEWRELQLPLIAYIMTDPGWKNHGAGLTLARQSLRALHEKGCPEVRCVITAGNTPSEKLFSKLGFQKITPP